jgi:hypothetical protein
VLRALDVDMPTVDVSGIRAIPMAPRRQVTPPASPPSPSANR